jgi:isocitrate lyase
MLFLELGVDEGVIVARDSEGASLTQKLPVSTEPGDLASQYCFVEAEEITIGQANEDDVLLKRW